uniref:Mediator of RNA polymerase II transcription subunit 14 RM6 domain-containing protein n=1 Tax=Globodera rostochiensis TaxID=31243 RepID=A0A914HVP1_GLORO
MNKKRKKIIDMVENVGQNSAQHTSMTGRVGTENTHEDSGEKKNGRLLRVGKWLGTHLHLQAAFAAIEDRLLFFRLCEELDARGILYERVVAERIVGGHVLRLTDISSMATRHGVEFADFFQNLLHCNIRLAQPFPERSQLECTFTNPPLVPDFNKSEAEVEADRLRPQTWVQPVGTGPPPSHRSRAKMFTAPVDQQQDSATNVARTDPPGAPLMSQVIAQNIEDRLLTYCQIYVPIRRFSSAYYAHFRHFCNIRTFAYFKLSLAYGDQRDLLLVLAWRWQKYSLCFGQAPLPSGSAWDGRKAAKRRWNPHVLVHQSLTERFNRDRDLVWLVNYLINTHRSLDSIHNFVRTQMHSTKTAAQVLGTEVAFPAELMCHLCALDEHTIRLSYGSRLAMEFLLLDDNRVAVRDCSFGLARSIGGGGPSLADFWHFWQQKMCDVPSPGGNGEEIGGQKSNRRSTTELQLKLE